MAMDSYWNPLPINVSINVSIFVSHSKQLIMKLIGTVIHQQLSGITLMDLLDKQGYADAMHFSLRWFLEVFMECYTDKLSRTCSRRSTQYLHCRTHHDVINTILHDQIRFHSRHSEALPCPVAVILNDIFTECRGVCFCPLVVKF